MSGLLSKASVWAFVMGWQPWDRDCSLLEGWARSGPLVPLGVLTQGVSCTFSALTHGWCPYPPKPKGTRWIPVWASSFHKGQHLGGGTQFFFSNFLFCVGVWQPVNNIAILSDGQQRDSVTHIYTHKSILPQIPLPPRLPHNIEHSFLYCTVGPCWLHSSVYMSIPNFLSIPSSLLSPWEP